MELSARAKTEMCVWSYLFFSNLLCTQLLHSKSCLHFPFVYFSLQTLGTEMAGFLFTISFIDGYGWGCDLRAFSFPFSRLFSFFPSCKQCIHTMVVVGGILSLLSSPLFLYLCLMSGVSFFSVLISEMTMRIPIPPTSF